MSLMRLLSVPYESKSPVNVYARMYGGIESGRMRAHSKNLLPKKSKFDTSQAVPVPTINVIPETPINRNKELLK